MNKQDLEYLLKTMRQLADEIGNYNNEANWHYEWMDTNYCTVGMLAKSLMGVDRYYNVKEVEDKSAEYQKRYDRTIAHRWSTWSERATVTCTSTGLPLSAIVQFLFQHGLTPQDLIELEFGSVENKQHYQSLSYELKDIAIEEGTGFNAPLDAARHLEEVADKLEARYAHVLAPQQVKVEVPVKPKTQEVPVHVRA